MIDSHCHLADEAFAPDVGAVVSRARAAGLSGALCILDARSDEECARGAELASGWPGLLLSVGVHPHLAGEFDGRPGDAARTVATRLASLERARAIGEIGLDYHYDFAPRPVQQAVFREQLSLARERGLPVVIHAREADEDALAAVRAEGGAIGGVFHCFTSDLAFARRVLDAGFHVSIAGIVSFPKAASVREVAGFVPRDRLLIETDSPYLAPVPHRGKRNEPAWVVRVAEVVAEVRGVSVATIDAATSEVFERLFGPAHGPAAR